MKLKSFCIRTVLQLATFALTVAVASSLASGQIFTDLYNFGSNPMDPFNLMYSGVLAQGRDGDLYTTSPWSGPNGSGGSMFKITPAGTVQVLYSFNGTVGGNPFSGLTLGADGNFYGTVLDDGNYCQISQCGMLFKITPAGSANVLYDFTGNSEAEPMAPPIQGADGSFYGTTTGYFGTAINNYYGAVFKFTPSGQYTTLHQFNGADGSNPYAPLVQGTNGNLYGTTFAGGANGDGVVFQVTPDGQFTVLYNFDGTHGMNSYAPLIQGNDGNFYGTTGWGGESGNGGVIFKISPAGKLTVLHTFNSITDGSNPFAGLVQASDGNLYGVASCCGPLNSGTIFKITPQGDFSVLYSFDFTTGSSPEIGLLQHTNGILFGATKFGGPYGNGNLISGFGTFFSLDAGLPQFVRLLQTAAKVGQNVEILGQGFTGASGVSFNGTSATFTVLRDTYLRAIVPVGVTTGFVTVTTPSGTVTSNQKFRVRE